jgi:GAF domain-containing protein
MSVEVQRELAEHVEEVIGGRRRRIERDPEYRALRKLADRNRRHPPKNPHDALQHVTDVAKEMTQSTFAALAVTGTNDYVEGFIVAGMDEKALAALKGPPQGHGPLGDMRQDGLAVHFADVSVHEKAFGFPPKHPPMKELLGVPIMAGGDVRGALYVTDPQRKQPFTRDDEAALRVLAHHAGLIIQRSWY